MGQYLALDLRHLLGVLSVQCFCHHRVQRAAGLLPPRLLILCLQTINERKEMCLDKMILSDHFILMIYIKGGWRSPVSPDSAAQKQL